MRFAPTGPGFLIYYTLQEYSVLIANLYSEYDDAAVIGYYLSRCLRLLPSGITNLLPLFLSSL